MAIAPSIDSNSNSSEPQSMVRIFGEDDRLFLVFSQEIDEDMPPLAEDFTVSIQGQATAIRSMDVQIEKGITALAFFLEGNISKEQEVSVRYVPTSWYMCSVETGESFPAFEECVVPLGFDQLDAEIRLKTRFDISAKSDGEQSKLPEAKLRTINEFCLMLAFDAPLDSIISLDKDDFRAEHHDRWLRITTLKYVRSQNNDEPEIQIEFAEPMTPGDMVKVEYRSPESRLKTLSGDPIPPFVVEAEVDIKASKDHLSVVESEADKTVLPSLNLAGKGDNVGAGAPDQPSVVVEQSSTQVEPVKSSAGVESAPAETVQKESTNLVDEASALAETSSQAKQQSAPDSLEDGLPPITEEEAIVSSEPESESNSLPENIAETVDAIEEENGSDEGVVALSGTEEIADTAENTPVEEISPETEELSEAEVADFDGALETENSESQGHDEQSVEHVSDEEYGLAYAQEVEAVSDELIEAEESAQSKSKLEQVFSALDAKTEPKQKAKTPLSTTAKIVYAVPIVILAWVLIVVCIYLATIVFDIEFSSSDNVVPITSSEREPCRIRSDDGSVYEGDCLNGVRDGTGVFTWPSGNYYVGEWVNGEQQGAGKLVYASGAIYEGGFNKGREHGSGRMKWPNGAVYAGKYENGRFSGQGMYLSAEGNRYVGEFKNGNMTENGQCIMKSGDRYDGPCRSQGAPKQESKGSTTDGQGQ